MPPFSNKENLLFLSLNFIGIILCLIFSSTAIVDELEHLRAGWFVSLGEIPYRDFWEHHHPFIWFLFAPVIKVLPQDNITTLYTGRVLAFLFSCGSTYVLYLMAKRFFGGKQTALLTVILSFLYFPAWYSFSIFKPDTFMRFFYLLGLYNFFIYLAEKQLKNLIVAGTSFTLSFLFLQTIASCIAPLIIPLGFFLHKNPRQIKNIFIATLPAVFILSGFACYLYITDSWRQYIETNWLFNAYFSKVLTYAPKDRSFSVFGKYFLLIFSGYATYICLWRQKQSSIYINTIAVLLTCELLTRLSFSFMLPHYLILTFIFSSILTAQIINKLPPLIVKYTKIFLFMMIILNGFTIYIKNNRHILRFISQLEHDATYITYTNDDMLNIYAPRPSYYWLYLEFSMLDNAQFNRLPDYDISKLIKQNNITYIFGTPEQFRRKTKNLPPKFNADILNKYLINKEIFDHYEEIAPAVYRLKQPFTPEEQHL